MAQPTDLTLPTQAPNTPILVGISAAPPPPPPPSGSLILSAPTSGTVNATGSASIQNTTSGDLAWTLTGTGGVTPTPASGTTPAGQTTSISLAFSAAGTARLTLTSPGATSGTPADITVAPAPALLLSGGASSGSVGQASAPWTITGQNLPAGVTNVTITRAPSGTLSTPGLALTPSSPSGQFTLTPVAEGVHTLSFANDRGIANPSAVGYTATAVSAPPPPPPAPPPGALPIFTLGVGAVSGTQPFAFAHAFRDGDVPAGQLVVGGGVLDWQCTPLTYWPSGCLKHAIIAGRASVAASTDLPITLGLGSGSSGSALTEADLTTALGATAVEIEVDADTTTLDDLIGTAALHTTVCTGPVMSNWVYRRAVSGNAHLVVFIDVRLFKGGAIEIFAWIENGYLAVASPTNYTKTCTVSIGGVERFSQSIDIKHHTRVALMTGGSFSYWVGTDPQLRPKHDRDYLIGTKLLPNIGLWGAPAGATLDALQQTYSPNTLAGDTTANGAAGGEGGIISVPSAYYLTSSADARAYKAMMAHGLSSGSWSHHYRDEATNLPIAFSARPLATLADTSTPTIPTPTGGENAAGPAMSHSVSYAYLPWLVTGRWWFLEELHFWATFGYLSTSAAYRGNGAGWHVHAQPRFRAWSLNVLAQSASVTPASHPLRAEFVASWEANTSRHYGRFVSGTVDSGTWVSPIGVLGTYSGAIGQPSPFPPPIPASPATEAWWDGIYQQNYLATVFGYTRDIGIPQSSQSQSDHVAVSNHAYKLVVGRANDGRQGRYNWRRFICYGMPVGTDDAGIPLDNWYTTHDQAYAELVRGYGLATLDPAYGGTLKSHSSDTDLAGSSLTYGSTALAALALAVDHDAPGAGEGWYLVSGASNFSTFASYFTDEAPYWGIKPRRDGSSIVPALGTVANLGTQTVDQVAGAGRTFWVAYGGICWAPFWGRFGSIIAMGGGHGDGATNDIYRIDVETGQVTQIKPAAPAFAGPNAEAGDLTTGWMWDSAAGTGTQVGEPMTCHRHASLLWMPERAFAGEAAANGWLYEAWAGAVPYTGNGSCVTSHRLKAGVDVKWTIHGSANAPSVRIQGFWFHQAYGAAYDEKRRKVWYQASATVSGGFPSSVLGSRDLANSSALGDTTFTPQAPAAAFNASYETLERSDRHDLMFSTGRLDSGNYSRLVVWDPVDNKMYEPAQTGTVPTLGVNTARGWCDAWNAFVFYPGQGSTVYFLAPTGNPRTSAWQWTARTFTGAITEFPAGPQPGFNRLVPIPGLPDRCMVWCCRTSSVVQMIRVAAP